jgi:CRISPR system Cascade subunit CasC
MYGGVERARISSASLKRAIRTSAIFEDRFRDSRRLGTRTRRIGDAIVERLVGYGLDEAEIRTAMAPVLAGFGKVDEGNAGRIKQLAFVSPEELDAATDVVRQAVVARGDAEASGGLRLADTVQAVDIALFGRMLAESAETIRMTAAADVSHPFSVGKTVVEADFYVAVDDRAVDEEDVASGFMGDAFYTSGLFYGYTRLDMEQLAANLGGNRDLAEQSAAAFIEAVAIVSPAGRRASFGSHSIAPWMMVERGDSVCTSLAAAFLRPVASDDHLAEAKTRLESLAADFERAYQTRWTRCVMDVMGGRGTLAELAAIASATAARDD